MPKTPAALTTATHPDAAPLDVTSLRVTRDPDIRASKPMLLEVDVAVPGDHTPAGTINLRLSLGLARAIAAQLGRAANGPVSR